jgi:hypothetical protein
MTQDALARFRAGFATCELAALVDVSTGTVLMTDSAIRLGQEHLDALCASAQDLWPLPAPDWPASAILSGPTGSRVFLRSSRDPTEVLCCLFAPQADLAGLDEAAHTLFNHDPGA